MAINVKLPEALVETAKRYGAIERRSVPKQIEHWTQIGRIALFWRGRKYCPNNLLNSDCSVFWFEGDSNCR